MAKHGGARLGGGRKASMEVTNKLVQLGCDPIAIMAHIAMADYEALGLLAITGEQVTSTQAISIELRAAMARELAQYIAPKRRAIDLSAGGGDITVQVVNFAGGQKAITPGQLEQVLEETADVVAETFDDEDDDD